MFISLFYTTNFLFSIKDRRGFENRDFFNEIKTTTTLNLPINLRILSLKKYLRIHGLYADSIWKGLSVLRILKNIQRWLSHKKHWHCQFSCSTRTASHAIYFVFRLSSTNGANCDKPAEIILYRKIRNSHNGTMTWLYSSKERQQIFLSFLVDTGFSRNFEGEDTV